MRRALPLAFLALAGCAAPRAMTLATPPAVVAPPEAPAQGGTFLVDEVQDALARRDSDAAVRLAELAVAAEPTAPVARAALARSYVAAGRFDAAAAAWADVLAVRPADRAASLGRALALLAGGNRPGAIAILDRLDGPAGDIGLAYALAGDPHGLPMLAAAAAAPGATARVRQNLALAHALAGDWAQARAVAATDVPAALLPSRLSDWARLAGAPPARRVAILLGVTPAGVDFGRPPTLATPRPRVITLPVPALPKPRTVSYSPPEAARPLGWLVQLGAYASSKEREAAWASLEGQPALKGHAPVLDAKQPWHRLSLSGFPNRLQAKRLCLRLKQAGTDCFVRLDAPSV